MKQEVNKQQNDPVYNTVNFFVLVKNNATAFIEFVEKVFDGHENKKNQTPDKDGTLIHGEVQVGNSMILVADSKPDWPFTPAFPQVYVNDAHKTLMKAQDNGAIIITEVSEFYGGLNLARFKDPWQNIWWLFEKNDAVKRTKKTDESKPSYIYTTIMDAMRNLKPGK